MPVFFSFLLFLCHFSVVFRPQPQTRPAMATHPSVIATPTVPLVSLIRCVELRKVVEGATGEFTSSLLASYKPHSNQVYGHLTPAFVSHLGGLLCVDASTKVLDIGCGTGATLFQLAMQFGCDASGVEIRPELVDVGVKMQRAMVERMSSAHFEHVAIAAVRRAVIAHGDATAHDFDGCRTADVVLLNNVAFDAKLTLALLCKFERDLRPGARVVALVNLFPRYRSGSRRVDSLNWMADQLFGGVWGRHTAPSDCVSWTSSQLNYYVYTRCGGENAN
jgi:SAM-dependent methyltransferase